jgi:hypothetical protein
LNRRLHDIHLVIASARALQKAGRHSPVLTSRQQQQKARWAGSTAPPSPPSGLSTSGGASVGSAGSGGGCLLKN